MTLSITRETRNVALLVFCQALAMTSITILFTVAALIGDRLAVDKSLATLPLALLQIAVMITTIPASLLMKQRGRRFGFVLGTVIGLVGAGLGVASTVMGNFWLFCLATTLFGIFNGFVGFYRFAAADAASESFRAQAISFVVAGGVVAAVVGPGLASWTKDWLTATFAGSLVPIVGLQVVTLGVLQGIDMPPLSASEQRESGRSLGQIMQQPVFIVATLGSMVGYGVMVLLMTATPLAMVAIDHPFEAAASVIQWHILGMFAPSFFTGFLIARFGVLSIILSGIVLNFLCVGVNGFGVEVGHFRVALTLLGIGWNFMFVGSTTLLTATYTPAEKAKTQAMHDFLMFACVAVATFLSGRILNDVGWTAVNQTAVPGLVLALVAVLWLRQQQGQHRPIDRQRIENSSAKNQP
jgi:predicted MFS family arabinose efflux permease